MSPELKRDLSFEFMDQQEIQVGRLFGCLGGWFVGIVWFILDRYKLFFMFTVVYIYINSGLYLYKPQVSLYPCETSTSAVVNYEMAFIDFKVQFFKAMCSTESCCSVSILKYMQIS